MKCFSFDGLPEDILVEGGFDSSCVLKVSDESLDAIRVGRLKVKLKRHGGKPVVSNADITIGSVFGSITIFLSNDGCEVFLGKGSSGSYDIRLWRASKVVIGPETTSNGVRIICDRAEFICGEDCMFSDNVLVQCSDQHGIVDLERGIIVNNKYNSVVLGDHVWLGRKSTLTASASIGSGSVIGTGTTVTSKIPEKVIAAGVPARVIKENHTWCRMPNTLDQYSKRYIYEFNLVEA